MTRREPTTAEVLATLHTHDGDTIAARLRAELDIFNYGTRRANEADKSATDLERRVRAADRKREVRARKKDESA